MGSRVVELYRSSEQNWLAAAFPAPKQEQLPPPPQQQNFQQPQQVQQMQFGPGSPCLRLRGCPYAAQAADVAGFLGNYAIPNENVVIGVSMEGTPSGDAYVRLHDAGVADRI